MLRRLLYGMSWMVAGIYWAVALSDFTTQPTLAISVLLGSGLVFPLLLRGTRGLGATRTTKGQIVLFFLVPLLVQSCSLPAVQPSPSPVATPSLPVQPPEIALRPSPTPSLPPSPSPKEPTLAPPPSAVSPLRQTTLVAQEPGAQINVRTAPSTQAVAQHYGYAGDQVEVLEQATNEAGETWYRLQFLQSGASGWVRSDFVAAGTTLPTATPAATPPLDPEAPIRAGVSGSCDCPYDTDRAGRRCGARSAYSRPGGSTPICDVKDQS